MKSDNLSAPLWRVLEILAAVSSTPSPRLQLGRNVSRLRLAAGMTQDKLAELADIDRRYVQRIEAGIANPGIDVLGRLRMAFGVEWNDLLGK